jgi:hypothetical protein
VDYDVNMGSMDMLVFIDEVRPEYAGKELGRCHRMLLGLNVDGILD